MASVTVSVTGPTTAPPPELVAAPGVTQYFRCYKITLSATAACNVQFASGGYAIGGVIALDGTNEYSTLVPLDASLNKNLQLGVDAAATVTGSVKYAIVGGAYLTGSQMLRMYDQNRILQWLSDETDGTPAAANTINTNQTMADLLLMASSQFDAACLVDARYNQADLAVQAADDTASTGAFIRRIVGDVVFGMLAGRRAYSIAEISAMAPFYQNSMDWLEQMRLGERIMNIDGTPQAGLPSVARLGGDIGYRRSILAKTRLWGFVGQPCNGWGSGGGE